MAERMTALEAYRAGMLTLPPGYELETDAEVLLLLRDDGTLVAGFDADRVVPSEVAWAAEVDHRWAAKGAARAPGEDPSRYTRGA